METAKPFRDVMVTVAARVYDEDDYGNAQAALEHAVRKAWGQTYGKPRAANNVGELLPGDDVHAVIRIVEIAPLSTITQDNRVRIEPGPQAFRFVPETTEDEVSGQHD